MCDTTSRGARGSVGDRPRWGALYAATLPQLGALGVFLAMGAWLRANRPAFDLQDWCDCAGQQMTVRVIESRRPRPVAFPLDPPVFAPAPAEEEYEVAAR